MLLVSNKLHMPDVLALQWVTHAILTFGLAPIQATLSMKVLSLQVIWACGFPTSRKIQMYKLRIGIPMAVTLVARHN